VYCIENNNLQACIEIKSSPANSSRTTQLAIPLLLIGDMVLSLALLSFSSFCRPILNSWIRKPKAREVGGKLSTAYRHKGVANSCTAAPGGESLRTSAPWRRASGCCHINQFLSSSPFCRSVHLSFSVYETRVFFILDLKHKEKFVSFFSI
jgi:hypothetical protein